jgi:hypothetical protein
MEAIGSKIGLQILIDQQVCFTDVVQIVLGPRDSLKNKSSQLRKQI